MQFLMYPNPASEEARALSARLAQRLLREGQQVCAADQPELADIAVVLGGDGTVLRAIRTLQAEKPIWAVNCGHLGYLTDCQKENAMKALDKILQSEFHLEYRTRLGGTLMNGTRVSALNEILFHRGACVHTLEMEVSVNGSLALRYRGDGLILCTPSGSTAYNLSAGGPVLMPEMELMALTPICAQSLSAVPIVVSSHDHVAVRWYMSNRDGQEERPDLTMDGQEKYLLPLEGTLDLNGELPPVALVRTEENDFYRRLQHRMHWHAE
ncbi:MAG: NAD(+)/NADH kinase [Clostridia bacterium]|nr:NAD(+)/NADH kinase [Clostridia bacterium]